MRHAITIAFLLALPTLALAESPEYSSTAHGPEQILERIKDKHPEKYAHLMELRQSNPHLFHKQMMRLRRQLIQGDQDPEVMERMEEMRTLRSSFQEVVEAYEAAVGKAKEKLRDKLTALATDIFEARQAFRRRKLERAKEHIEELQDEIDERDEIRDELIQKFVDQALDDGPRGL